VLCLGFPAALSWASIVHFAFAKHRDDGTHSFFLVSWPFSLSGDGFSAFGGLLVPEQLIQERRPAITMISSVHVCFFLIELRPTAVVVSLRTCRS